MTEIPTNDVMNWKRSPRRTKILLVPGDIVYDHLKLTDPTKLERLLRDERRRYEQSHAPGYEQQYHEKVQVALDHVAQMQKRSPDYQLLGLDQFEGMITRQRVVGAFRRKAKELHPDIGGSHDQMTNLSDAYQRVLARLRMRAE